MNNVVLYNKRNHQVHRYAFFAVLSVLVFLTCHNYFMSNTIGYFSTPMLKTAPTEKTIALVTTQTVFDNLSIPELSDIKPATRFILKNGQLKIIVDQAKEGRHEQDPSSSFNYPTTYKAKARYLHVPTNNCAASNQRMLYIMAK
jgi:hypothetical protein